MMKENQWKLSEVAQYIENKVARIICNNVEAVPHRKYRFFKVGT